MFGQRQKTSDIIRPTSPTQSETQISRKEHSKSKLAQDTENVYRNDFEQDKNGQDQLSKCSSLKTSTPEVLSLRSSVWSSCLQVVSVAITALFLTIKESNFYSKSVADNANKRTGKLLYVQVLEKVQRERGEWRGFQSEKLQRKSIHERDSEKGPEILLEAIQKFVPDERVKVLNEVVEVSFRNLRGPLVPSSVYTSYKKEIAMSDSAFPASMSRLLVIRALLSEVSPETKYCLLRLLCLLNACTALNTQSTLHQILQESPIVVFTDVVEEDFMASRAVARHDNVALGLMKTMTYYSDVLFSDIEYHRIRSEMELPLNRSRIDANEIAPSSEYSNTADDTDDDSAAASRRKSTSQYNRPLNIPKVRSTVSESEFDQSRKSFSRLMSKRSSPSSCYTASDKNAADFINILGQETLLTRWERAGFEVNLDRSEREDRGDQLDAYSSDSVESTRSRRSVRSDSMRRKSGKRSVRPIRRKRIGARVQVAPSRATERDPKGYDALTTPYMSFSIAAATLCTMATMIFFAWKKQ
uniref:Uncharacterized protein AlNc14C469G11826 n=1 Tax=Albugo laibachii Nc14 TaxID=890382 RepID=F0X088_9STRA|nr:conserved hypothetical protein [Albugo laibachii Nc14]|eukprot:CCA27170.1 conserved hypothetical protein [Albugo laibachii Nc14]